MIKRYVYKDGYLELRISIPPIFLKDLNESMPTLGTVSTYDPDTLKHEPEHRYLVPIDPMRKENVEIGVFFDLSEDADLVQKLYQTLSKFDCTITVITDEDETWFWMELFYTVGSTYDPGTIEKRWQAYFKSSTEDYYDKDDDYDPDYFDDEDLPFKNRGRNEI